MSEQILIALAAFALGYLCGLLTKHELWVWVKTRGKKPNKKK